MRIRPVTVYVKDDGDSYEDMLEDFLVRSRGIQVFTEDEYLDGVDEYE
jgi:hypothetical protein